MFDKLQMSESFDVPAGCLTKEIYWTQLKENDKAVVILLYSINIFSLPKQNTSNTI